MRQRRWASWALSRIIAMEGLQKNVRSNVIAPFAWTRMIATIPIKDEASAKRVERMKNMMRPDQVAQLAVSLASPATKDVSGQIFVARGNEIFLMSQPRPVRGIGKVEGWTPQTIAEHAMAAMKPSFFDLGATTSVFLDGIRSKRGPAKVCSTFASGTAKKRCSPVRLRRRLVGEFGETAAGAAHRAFRQCARIGPEDFANLRIRFESLMPGVRLTR